MSTSKCFVFVGSCLLALLLAPKVLFTQARSQTPGSSTIPSDLQLQSTFQSISVKAPFAGDENGNNSAIVQFRKTGATAWLNAYTPIFDRRATVGGMANPYVNQVRASIVGLSPNVSYEVQVVWTDSDGVSLQPGAATINTLSYTPPTGGTTITVTDDATLSIALDRVNPGQTIRVNPGTYAPFTISRSGNAGAWIVVEGDFAGRTIVSGADVRQSILINANYVILQHFTLAPSDWSGIQSTGRHIFIQDNVIQDVSRLCAKNIIAHYGDAGIKVGGPNTNVLRNAVNSTSLSDPACTDAKTRWESPAVGINHGGGLKHIVIANNIITGGFRDGIGGDGAGQGIENIDIANNTISGFKDDAVELDGDDVNVRVWGNRILVDNGDSAISNAPTRYGPSYLFRNFIQITTSQTAGTTVFKLYGDATIPNFIFHNTIKNDAPKDWDNIIGVQGLVLNNIFRNRGLMYYNVNGNTVTDYNNYLRLSGSHYARNWGGSSFDNFSQFRTGTGQESHGKEADPLLDGKLHIARGSPAYDAGVVIPNFNDATSAWPFAGSSPDIGAYEVEGER